MMKLSAQSHRPALRLATPYIALSEKPVSFDLFDARKWNQGIVGTGG